MNASPCAPRLSGSSYEEGLRDGQIMALEKIVSKHQRTMDGFEERLRRLEKVIYVFAGAVGFIEALPIVGKFMG